MPGAFKPCVAGGVHVQEVAGARPLVSLRGVACSPPDARDPVAIQDLPDRRVRVAGLASDQPRPPTGALPRLADPLLGLGVKQPRASMRTAAAIHRPRTRPALVR